MSTHSGGYDNILERAVDAWLPSIGVRRVKYFRLRDDLLVPQRWHLGDVSRAGNDLKVALDARSRVGATPVTVVVTQPGIPLDFSLTAFNVPIVSSRLARVVAALITPSDVEFVPAQIEGGDGFAIVNVLRTIDCVDETNSEFRKWTSSDHRADLAGQYRQFDKFRVDVNSIPADANLFRVWGWIAFIGSESLKRAIEAKGYTGATFTQV